MYADDTTIVSAENNVANVKNTTEIGVSSAVEWFNKNKLVVNAKKSNIIFLGSSHKLMNIASDFTIALGPNKIDRSTEIKLLGVIIDQNLNFSKHVEYHQG